MKKKEFDETHKKGSQYEDCIHFAIESIYLYISQKDQNRI